MRLNFYLQKSTLILMITFTFLGCGDDTNTTAPISISQCSITAISDDTAFTDSYPADIEWSGSAENVDDIARVYNNARAHDSTITQELVMPSQAIWDSMSVQERGLYLLNNERYYRGIKPYGGISDKVSAVSQDYANLLYNTGTFGHYEDENPVVRLDRDTDIANNRDFFSYAENLYAHGSSAAYAQNPIAQAIYGFIYDDDAATDGSYGHRNFCLATGLNDNSGESGEEGLVGFAITKGDAYTLFPDMFSTIVVMNAFDPSASWNHDTTLKVPFCTLTATP